MVEVVAAVIERDGRLLITRRPPGAHLAGFWEFPGGKREPGERAVAALEREIREELGARVTVGGVIDTVEWPYPEKRVRISFFRCALDGEPAPPPGLEMAWVTPDELTRYEFPPADAALIARLRAG